MPAERDNSKIEELLKAYARKRREQAGNGMELHPAVRKMLQGEVARQKPRGGPEGRNLVSLLLRLWPRFAFVGAAVLILSFVLWNAGHSPKAKRMEMARVSDRVDKDLDGSAPAAPAPTAAPSFEPAFRSSDAMTRKSSAPATRGLELDDKASPAVSQNAPAEMESAQLSRGREKQEESKSLAVLKDRSAGVSYRDEAKLSLQRGDEADALKAESRPAYRVETLASGGNRQQTANELAAATPSSASSAAATKPQSTTTPGQSAPVAVRANIAGPQGLAGSDPKAREPLLREGEVNGALFGVSTSAAAYATSTGGAMLAYDAPKQSFGGESVQFYAGGFKPAQAADRRLTENGAVDSLSPVVPPIATAATPTPAPVAAWSYGESTSGVINVRFVNALAQVPGAAPVTGRFYRQKADAKASTPLSSTFDIQQDGKQIRIIDADGSVYSGTLLVATPQVRLRAARDLKPEGGLAGAEDQISFTASGTNRTSKKMIAVTGTLTSGAKEQAKTEAAQPASPSISEKRISGITSQHLDATIRVDRTNETRIQAIRVSP